MSTYVSLMHHSFFAFLSFSQPLYSPSSPSSLPFVPLAFLAMAAAALTVHQELMEAVERLDVAAVQSALARGADANWRRSAEESDEDNQPTTPLRMVMFRLSDCGLSDEERGIFGDIARILLAAGADPVSAAAIAEARYGQYDAQQQQPPTPFQAVWTIVAQAAEQKLLNEQC